MHPDRGLLPPSVLVPLAERCGLIGEVGQWVLRQAWSDQRGWNRDGAQLALSVNVSAHELMSAGFAHRVATALREISERAFVRDGDRARIVLNDLKEIGVRLALDNFGTGFSSLNHLRRYPIDTISVDRQFVAVLHRDAATRAVMGALIGLAHDLGMTVTSEGVETSEQHRDVTTFGCDSCQGFYFARPMPASTLAHLIRPNGHPTAIHLPTATTPPQA
jgi:diguanylate cyclase